MTSMGMSVFTVAIGSVKFDVANLYIKVPSDSNRLFPLDVLNILCCHQPVPCTLVTYVILPGKG